MKAKNAIKLLLIPIAFAYGIGVGMYKIFPYNQLYELKSLVVSGDNSDHFPPGYVVKKDLYHAFPRTGNVLMVGDSLTDNARWDDIFPSTEIVNRGIAGDTTQGLLERIDDVTNVKPKYVFIMIGTNDIGNHVTNDEIIQNYTKIINNLKDTGAKVFVQSTILSWDKQQGKNERIKKLNESLLTLSNSMNVNFIDLNKNLSPDGFLKAEYTVDGTHLNYKGYSAWKDAISKYFDVINKELN
ncbi:GDSL-type esterase/lipase family protein [Serratia fonticola]|uniref:GDSL-type esterase/lipase family protein n=1 Tax=Serratia fonticola TaxID=47917 RepID=UPI00192D0D45|nr:GDSL-type esterase/lipase family protein [Serratia fonticola]MBL5825437.1 hypothetical protein [Serratia fonticola]